MAIGTFESSSPARRCGGKDREFLSARAWPALTPFVASTRRSQWRNIKPTSSRRLDDDRHCGPKQISRRAAFLSCVEGAMACSWLVRWDIGEFPKPSDFSSSALLDAHRRRTRSICKAEQTYIPDPRMSGDIDRGSRRQSSPRIFERPIAREVPYGRHWLPRAEQSN
jgi:hypothetical protein